MNKKRLKFNVGLFATIFLVAGISVYYFIPNMFADTVYPLEYANFIVKYSKQYSVDPALVAAVIFQESRFNPKSVSGAGAQGLMQFMPGTAATMAKETGRWPKYDIFDAETSVDFGAAHLRDLLQKYNGSEELALYAYNTGTGSADKYAGSPASIANFGYVKRIMNYQKIYHEMYATELDIAPITLQKDDTSSQTQVRGFVWSQIFSNFVGSLTGKKQ
jgi:soluble lytic murein transglycosylase